MPTPGAPKASKKTWVWDRPSYRIPATAKATRTRLARSRSAASSPEANRRTARRSGRSALGSSGRASGARRPMSPNQTEKTSPLRRQAVRPYWAIAMRVRTV